ncbi:MAG: hypothetical protein ABIT05_01235 [Chitinophagaceae bacterium]
MEKEKTGDPVRNRLRKFKGYIIYDAGRYLETGDNMLEIEDAAGGVAHVKYFDRALPEALNKCIERAKDWINEQVKDSATQPAVKERTCRVCGCTQDNCQQCIDKTGGPCHWVEEDLCSACVDKPIETNDQSSKNNNDMNFFQQLSGQGDVDITIRILKKNDKITLNVIPGGTSKLQPILATGTPEELDEEFFKSVMPGVQEISGFYTNVSEVKEQAKTAADKIADNKNTASPKYKKKVQTKKTAPKKPVSKPVAKPAVKKPVKKKVAPKKPVETNKAPKVKNEVEAKDQTDNQEEATPSLFNESL